MHHSNRPAWIAVAWAVVVAWFAIDAQKPPAALPVDARSEVFAAGRAQKHVEAIARAPHPMGSSEAEYSRGILVQKLEELGLAPEIQAPKKSDSPARNVVARLKGRGPSVKKSLMLCAHYDSVAIGPGAGDNASGVAVVLETLRALRANPPLDRDVIVLFDDGEEVGLVGSRLFVDEHPWAKEFGVVLNKAWVASVLCSIPSLVLVPPLIRVVSDVPSVAMMTPIMLFVSLMVPIINLVVLFLGTMLPLLGPRIAPGPRHEHASLDGKA